jgi:hypothetical protein
MLAKPLHVAGVLPLAVDNERIGFDLDLLGDKGENRWRDELAWLQQASWIPERAELKREAQTVSRVATSIDDDQFGLAQRVALGKFGAIRG